MARLIDADTLLEVMRGKKGADALDGNPVMLIKVKRIVDNAPTIPAIPVAWIFEQMQILHELHNKNEYVLQWLIEMWQKEQEANDT